MTEPTDTPKKTDDKKASKSPDDVLLVVGRSQSGYQVLRQRQDRVEAGEVRPLEEGKPVAGDVVSLKPRQEHPNLFFDVDVQYSAPQPAPTNRPAQVASNTYRSGWDRVFKKSRPKQLN